jgi:hypothetical protein
MSHTATTRAEAFDPLQQKSPEYTRKCWGHASLDNILSNTNRTCFSGEFRPFRPTSAKNLCLR